VIQLYHFMDTVVARIFRAFVGYRADPSAGPRVLPAYAVLSRYGSADVDLEPRLRLLVTQLAAERSGCRWCIERAPVRSPIRNFGL